MISGDFIRVVLSNIRRFEDEVESMERSIRAGVTGFSLALLINLFSPVDLVFVPSFLGSILAIYLLRVGTFREGLVTSLLTYVFNDGVLGTLSLATLYLENQPYTLNVDVLTVFLPIANSITALIATYIGVQLVQRAKPSQELPPPVQPIPPV